MPGFLSNGHRQGARLLLRLSGQKLPDEAATRTLLDQVAAQLDSFQVSWVDGQTVLSRPHRSR
ncbi:hypothetical protein JST97_15435 [bacterium]|nr:hypothetical protein [bacterium]